MAKKIIIMLVIYSGNLQQVQGPKCIPHFSVAEIRISLLFEENVIFYPGTITAINSLL